MATWRADPEAWIEQLDASEARVSAWPGPRPLDGDDGIESLVGREKDIALFLHNITHARLIHLAGVSGTGKSSLLMAGIIPTLQERGYVVGICRDWANVPDDDVSGYLREKLRASIGEHAAREHKLDIEDDNPDEWFFRLDELRSRGVIILDQLEEVIHSSGKSQAALFNFLTNVNIHTGLVVVLSYRSEFYDRFAYFDRDARIEHTLRQDVLPVGEGAGLELLQSPIRPKHATDDWSWTDVVAPEVAQRISTDWEAARSAGDTTQRSPVGLLQLQALLFVLSMRARHRQINNEDYEKVRRDAVRARNRGRARTAQAPNLDPYDYMTFALEQSTQERIDLAKKAAADIRMDEYLLRGTITLLTRTVPHLSSGDLKLDREVAELADVVLKDEIENIEDWLSEPTQLNGDRELVTDIIRHTIVVMTAGGVSETDEGETPILAETRREIVRRVDEVLDSPIGEAKWNQMLDAGDPDGLSSGPIMGMSPLVAFIEEVRRYSWAVLWLHELNLARLKSDGETRGTIALVHDGLGPALRHWADRYERLDDTRSLFALIAPQGEVHDWDGKDDATDLSARVGLPYVVHANLGFKGNVIKGAVFGNAVFVNCDFTGTQFRGCTFRNVSFLNCRLDRALFTDCKVVGASTNDIFAGSSASDASLGDPQTYLVDDPERRLPGILSGYSEGASGVYLLSPSSGRPLQVADDLSGTVRWEAADGGLVIEGSWISALTLRGLTFIDNASLRFKRIVASGICVAELGGAREDHSVGQAEVTTPRIMIQASVLRNSDITGVSGSGSAEVYLDGSIFASSGVGSGISGRFEARSSWLTQVWIEQSKHFTVDIDAACTAYSVVGVDIDPRVPTFKVETSDNGRPAAAASDSERLHRLLARTEYKRPFVP
jgi:hypothetical protein